MMCRPLTRDQLTLGVITEPSGYSCFNGEAKARDTTEEEVQVFWVVEVKLICGGAYKLR